MSVAIEQSGAAHGHQPHVRHANFGSLVSAIRRGDLDAAQGAFEALSELAPKAHGWTSKVPDWISTGPLAAVGEAIKAGDIDAASEALKTFQQSRLAAPEQAPAEDAGKRPLRLGQTIDILA
jgi:hypothetical protein